MKTYIETIAGFMILLSFAQMLVGERFRRDTGFIMGLMLLAALCAPLKGFIPESIVIPEIKTDDTAKYDGMREQLIHNGIISSLENKIRLETGAERVICELDENNAIKSVTLYGTEADAKKKTADLCGIDEGKVIIENVGA